MRPRSPGLRSALRSILVSFKLYPEFLCDGAVTVENNIPAYLLVALFERARPEDVVEVVEHFLLCPACRQARGGRRGK